MLAKIEIYTFSICDAKDEKIKIKFEGETLKEIFNFLSKKMQNFIKEYPPTKKEKKTFKLATYKDSDNKQKSYFKYSEINKRIDGIITIGSDADKVMKFTSADKHKKESGEKTKGINIDYNHYFQIIFTEGSDSGFLILEKNQKSCKNDFCYIFEQIINKIKGNTKIKTKQFIEKKFYENYLKEGKYNSITCVRKGVKENNAQGLIKYVESGDYTIETKLTTTGDIAEIIKTKVFNAFSNNKYFFELNEFKDLKYTEENQSKLIINSNFNGKSRSIDLSNVLKMQPIYNLDDVKENQDGSSDFDSIRFKVNDLLDELDIKIY